MHSIVNQLDVYIIDPIRISLNRFIINRIDTIYTSLMCNTTAGFDTICIRLIRNAMT